MPAEFSSHAVTWRPLRLLTLYRLTLAGLLLIIALTGPGNSQLGHFAPHLFEAVSLTYFLFALVAGFVTRLHQQQFKQQVIAQTLVDILALSLLIYASAGLGSGLEVLLFIAVIAGSLLVPGRLSLFLAASATLASFGVLIAHHHGPWSFSELTPAGLLGLSLFAAASIAYGLGRYIRHTEALSAARAATIDDLTRLNATVLDHLPSGVMVCDPQGQILLMNRAARQLLATPAPLHPDPTSLLRRLDASGGELRGLALGGRELTLRELPIAGPEDSAPGHRLLLIDDQAELANRAQQIKLAALGRLTAGIAHELRNPLSAIGHAGQLLHESPGLSPDERQLTDIIHRHTRRVDGIIDTVLSLSRKQPVQPSCIELRPWLCQLRDETARRAKLPPDQLPVRVDPPGLAVYFDPGQLQQVLGNLLDNALRHGRGSAPPRVELQAGEEPDGHRWLEICDQGPGIAPAERERVFEPFHTSDARGTGLGLYIARELCATNHAELSYHPRPGGGSCFRIRFPAAAQTESSLP